jgi:hypothetical protein
MRTNVTGAHVDVRRGREGATVDLLTGEILAGSLPPQVLRQVRELLAEHRDEALQAFVDTLELREPRKLGEPGERK